MHASRVEPLSHPDYLGEFHESLRKTAGDTRDDRHLRRIADQYTTKLLSGILRRATRREVRVNLRRPVEAITGR